MDRDGEPILSYPMMGPCYPMQARTLQPSKAGVGSVLRMYYRMSPQRDSPDSEDSSWG
jgi:hypothetical protein